MPSNVVADKDASAEVGGWIVASMVATAPPDCCLLPAALQPELPSLAESGLAGFDAAAWLGLVAPAGTPRPIVERLNRELHRILAEPATRQRLSGLGAQVMTSTPDDFLAFMRSEYVKWGNAVRENNVKLD